MSKIDDAWGKRTKFLNAKLFQQSALDGDQNEHLKKAIDFPAYMAASDWKKRAKITTVSTIDAAQLNYRKTLNILANAQYGIPISDETMRQEIKTKFSQQFEQLLSNRKGRWQTGPKQYYEFIDALAGFAEGGAAPTSEQMNNGIAVLREWAGYYADSEKELHQKTTVHDERTEQALKAKAHTYCNHYILSAAPALAELSGEISIPAYIRDNDQVMLELDALRTELSVEKIKHDELNERMNALRDTVIYPLVVQHERLEGADLRKAAAPLKETEVFAQSKVPLYEYLIEQCAAIAADLDITIKGQSENRPRRPERRGF